VEIFTAALAVFSTCVAAVAASVASLHDIFVVARRNAAAAAGVAAGVAAAIPAVHAARGTHGSPCVIVAFELVDSCSGVVPGLESDCGFDPAFEAAVSQHGHRLLRQATTDLTLKSHKSLTM